MSERRNQCGMPEEDRSAQMLGIVMIGTCAGFVFFLTLGDCQKVAMTTKCFVIVWLLLALVSLGGTAVLAEQSQRTGNAITTLGFLLLALGQYVRR